MASKRTKAEQGSGLSPFQEEMIRLNEQQTVVSPVKGSNRTRAKDHFKAVAEAPPATIEGAGVPFAANTEGTKTERLNSKKPNLSNTPKPSAPKGMNLEKALADNHAIQAADKPKRKRTAKPKTAGVEVVVTTELDGDTLEVFSQKTEVVTLGELIEAKTKEWEAEGLLGGIRPPAVMEAVLEQQVEKRPEDMTVDELAYELREYDTDDDAAVVSMDSPEVQKALTVLPGYEVVKQEVKPERNWTLIERTQTGQILHTFPASAYTLSEMGKMSQETLQATGRKVTVLRFGFKPRHYHDSSLFTDMRRREAYESMRSGQRQADARRQSEQAAPVVAAQPSYSQRKQRTRDDYQHDTFC